MSRQNDVQSQIGQILTMAPGSIVEVLAIPGQLATSIKYLAGGTLEIGGTGLISSSTPGFTVLAGGATWYPGQTFGTCYPISPNEVVSADNSGKVYLYASSATTTLAILRGRSAGDF